MNQKEDIEKWRNLLQERNDLKGNKLNNSNSAENICFRLKSDALQRTNATMRQQYSMVNGWHNSVKELKERHVQELNKFRDINDEVCILSISKPIYLFIVLCSYSSKTMICRPKWLNCNIWLK